MSKAVITVVAVCLVSLALCQSARAQEESYSGILATRNAGAQQTRFTFTITKWSTQDEIKQLGQVLKDHGQDALYAELKKLDALMTTDLSAFNKLIRDENVPAVQAPPKKAEQ